MQEDMEGMMPGEGDEDDLLLDPYSNFDSAWDYFATSFGADGMLHAPAKPAPAIVPLQSAVQEKFLARLHDR
jgi:hypothetical protein